MPSPLAQPSLSVRRATAADCSRLFPLYSEFHGELRQWVSDDELATALECLLARPTVTVYVATAEAQFQGYAALRRSEVTRETVLEDLYVAAPARGRGYGRALLETAIREARSTGCTAITLETSATNQASIALYTACGFCCASPSAAIQSYRLKV